MQLYINPFMLEGLYGGDPRPVLKLLALADGRGIDGVVLPEHILMHPDELHTYPYNAKELINDSSPDDAEETRFFDERTPFFEVTTYLAAIAAVTEHVTLSSSVMLSALRPATVLAKQLVTLDHLSGGRIEIGVGAGWLQCDYDAQGLPFKTRLGRMVETAEACREIWTSSPASYHGKLINFDKVYSFPMPIRVGGIPQWFGIGASEVSIERLARAADGWLPLQVPLDLVRATLPKIRARMTEFGRDPSRFGVRLQMTPVEVNGVPDIDATLATIPTLLATGATVVEIVAINFCASPGEFEPFIEKCLAAKERYSS
jgi:probable F420-dependent oxidoreductase